MAEKPTEQIEFECAELLKEMGFTEYEAYTFISLLRLGTGTARDIADLGHVPRTRVYDAIEPLHEAGLVDIKYASPKEYSVVSEESAIRKLELQLENTVTELSELFAELTPVEQRTEEFGVWTVTGQEAIISRGCEFINAAEDEIIFMTIDEVLTEEHLNRLHAAEERGVKIFIAGVSPAVQDRIQDRIPSATLFETLWEWSDAGAGSLLVCDRRTALVSVFTNGERGEGRGEMAIWGTGEQNSLVVVLRTIFTWRLKSNDHTSASG